MRHGQVKTQILLTDANIICVIFIKIVKPFHNWQVAETYLELIWTLFKFTPR